MKFKGSSKSIVSKPSPSSLQQIFIKDKTRNKNPTHPSQNPSPLSAPVIKSNSQIQTQKQINNLNHLQQQQQLQHQPLITLINHIHSSPYIKSQIPSLVNINDELTASHDENTSTAAAVVNSNGVVATGAVVNQPITKQKRQKQKQQNTATKRFGNLIDLGKQNGLGKQQDYQQALINNFWIGGKAKQKAAVVENDNFQEYQNKKYQFINKPTSITSIPPLNAWQQRLKQKYRKSSAEWQQEQQERLKRKGTRRQPQPIVVGNNKARQPQRQRDFSKQDWSTAISPIMGHLGQSRVQNESIQQENSWLLEESNAIDNKYYYPVQQDRVKNGEEDGEEGRLDRRRKSMMFNKVKHENPFKKMNLNPFSILMQHNTLLNTSKQTYFHEESESQCDSMRNSRAAIDKQQKDIINNDSNPKLDNSKNRQPLLQTQHSKPFFGGIQEQQLEQTQKQRAKQQDTNQPNQQFLVPKQMDYHQQQNPNSNSNHSSKVAQIPQNFFKNTCLEIYKQYMGKHDEQYSIKSPSQNHIIKHTNSRIFIQQASDQYEQEQPQYKLERERKLENNDPYSQLIRRQPDQNDDGLSYHPLSTFQHRSNSGYKKPAAGASVNQNVLSGQSQSSPSSICEERGVNYANNNSSSSFVHSKSSEQILAAVLNDNKKADLYLKYIQSLIAQKIHQQDILEADVGQRDVDRVGGYRNHNDNDNEAIADSDSSSGERTRSIIHQQQAAITPINPTHKFVKEMQMLCCILIKIMELSQNNRNKSQNSRLSSDILSMIVNSNKNSRNQQKSSAQQFNPRITRSHNNKIKIDFDPYFKHKKNELNQRISYLKNAIAQKNKQTELIKLSYDETIHDYFQSYCNLVKKSTEAAGTKSAQEEQLGQQLLTKHQTSRIDTGRFLQYRQSQQQHQRSSDHRTSESQQSQLFQSKLLEKQQQKTKQQQIQQAQYQTLIFPPLVPDSQNEQQEQNNHKIHRKTTFGKAISSNRNSNDLTFK